MQKSQSPIKQKVKEFVQIEDGVEFTFELEGTTQDGDNFVQAMRVALSRIRNLVRNKGFTVKPFKMKLISIKDSTANEGHVTIVLQKHVGNTEIANEIDDIFSSIAGGQTL